MNIESVIEGIKNDTGDTISPYKFAKVVNKWTGYDLPPQMVYNYVKKGYIRSGVNSTGKVELKNEDCVAWVTKYIAKREKVEENAE